MASDQRPVGKKDSTSRLEWKFGAVIEKRGRWYVAHVEEIPGVNTQGRTLAEARHNLREALQLILETNRRLAARERPRKV